MAISANQKPTIKCIMERDEILNLKLKYLRNGASEAEKEYNLAPKSEIAM